MVKRVIKRFLGIPDRNEPTGGSEQPASWYDETFSDQSADYHRHYTESRYYFLWSVIADRIAKGAKVLEIGCGPGQLAHYLTDRRQVNYIGFDFSEQAIKMARKTCPQLRFEVADAFTTDLLNTSSYDVVICTEVLEHVRKDLELVSRVKPGIRCLLSVPNFPGVSHVRHFLSQRSVAERYGPFFSKFEVDDFLKNPNNQRYYMLDGTRNSKTI